jgi:rhomboid protease GluP
MSESLKRSIICPNCRKLISSYEERCPYCGISNPGSVWRRGFVTHFFRNPYDSIKIIIYCNVALYALSLLLNPLSLGLSANPLTFLSPSSGSLFVMGATGTVPIDRFHWWWTLVSASYLHGGILHIFFNMVALWQLGPFVIREYGFNRFFTIYTLTGIAGFFVSYLAGVSFTIGASASLCGLIGAALYYGKSRGGSFGQAVYRQVMGWVIGLVLFGLMIPGINNWAHGGGIASGIALGYLLGYGEKKSENRFHASLSAGCVLLTFAILVWAILHGFYWNFVSR